jgi:hypothetical protein
MTKIIIVLITVRTCKPGILRQDRDASHSLGFTIL